MIPTATDRMTLRTNFLFPPDRFEDPELETKCVELLEGSVTVVNQDIMVNTSVQKNLASRFTPTGRHVGQGAHPRHVPPVARRAVRTQYREARSTTEPAT